ncbi:hypothetical protein HYT91_00635 [Candidatus Pacearchaeota archaeon]|nr:hypothetical protein [Candidatus Pacearchaeota archaeon]
MGWKHFWLTDYKNRRTSYCVNSYGALNRIERKYESVWLKYNEIIEILNLKTKEEKYRTCNELFNKKFPQSEKNKKELSKQEQSKLEKLFP